MQSSCTGSRSPAMRRSGGLFLLAYLVIGCAGVEAPPPAAPPSEPRALLHARVDLSRVQRCEEGFDLALYKNPGVELVAWDENAGACVGRTISVRYLPRRISAKELTALIASLAPRVEVLADKGNSLP